LITGSKLNNWSTLVYTIYLVLRLVDNQALHELLTSPQHEYNTVIDPDMDLYLDNFLQSI